MISVLFCSNLFAQTRQQLLERQRDSFKASWELTELKPKIIFNQTYLENWIKGGDDAYSFTILLDNDFVRTSNSSTINTIIDVRYGRSRIGKGGDSKISSNLLNMRSTLEIGKKKKVNPMVGCTINTQLTTGYKYYKVEPDEDPKEPKPISDFWDPVTMEYRYGITLNLVNDLTIEFSAEHIHKRAKTEDYAKEAKIDDRNTKDIIEKLKITKNMSTFIRYKKSFRDKLHFESISFDSKIDIKSAFKHYSMTTIKWTNKMSFQIISLLSFSINSQFIYEKTKSTRGQYQQISGISLSYDLKNIFSNDNNEEPEITFRTGVKVYDIDKIWARQLGLNSTEGALIVEVEEDSPGEKADLKKGDVITEVNGDYVKRVDDVLKCFDKAEPQPGKEINITVLRNGHSHKATLIVEEPQIKK